MTNNSVFTNLCQYLNAMSGDIARGISIMSPNLELLLFSTVSIVLIIAGITFAFFGLRILPVDRETLLPWESAIYGAIMMGWGTTLFYMGVWHSNETIPNL
jgi:hypothetical protein